MAVVNELMRREMIALRNEIQRASSIVIAVTSAHGGCNDRFCEEDESDGE
jgi:hypothetical protein